MRQVVVTGGASGIGAQMARRFAEAGDHVLALDVDARAVETFAPHENIDVRRVDVADEHGMGEALAGREIDVMLANAGTGGPAGPIEDLSLDDWRACLAVNLDGAFLACRAAAASMKPRGRGVIILTSSTSGLYGHPERSPYCTAKWGIIGLMQTLAMELGPHGIRANAICPGAVEGDRMERVLQAEGRARGVDPEELRRAYVSVTSMRTWVTAGDIAETAFWLASDAARFVSGQALAVDGHTESKRA